MRRMQAVPRRVMFEKSNDCKVELKALSFDDIDGVVHHMKDECMTVWQPSRQKAGSNLLIGWTIKTSPPGSSPRTCLWRGIWTTWPIKMTLWVPIHPHGISHTQVLDANPRPNSIFKNAENYRRGCTPRRVKRV